MEGRGKLYKKRRRLSQDKLYRPEKKFHKFCLRDSDIKS